MYLDKQNEFSNAQPVSLLGDTVSTHVLDCGEGAGDGSPLYLVVLVAQTVTSAGAATVSVSLEGDDVENFPAARTLWQGAATGKASLVAGHRLAAVALPLGAGRFLRVKYTVATASLSAGAFSAFLVRDPQTWSAQADAL